MSDKADKIHKDQFMSIEEPDNIQYKSNNENILSNQSNTNNSQYKLYSQSNKSNNNDAYNYNTVGNVSQIDYVENEFADNLEKYYIKVAKETTDLVPRELKNQVKLWNSMFLISSLGLICYNTAYFIVFYPESFSPQHIKKIKNPSVVLLLSSIGAYFLRQETYKKSLRLLQNNYSDQEIKMLIRKFYQTNSLSVQQSIINNNQGKR